MYRQMLTNRISSLVIDELCDRVTGQKIAVACFYCDFQSRGIQTPENVLGALIKQIVRGSGAIPKETNSAFQKAKSQIGGRGLRVPEALELLKAVLEPLDRAFICIDALDELLEKHLPQILRSLNTISQSLPAIRFFFTSRPHIKVEIRKYFPGGAQFFQVKSTKEDIMRYVETMLDDDSVPGAMNADLRADIMNLVSETISDVYVTAICCSSPVHPLTVTPRFLLVSLIIAGILDETTIYQRREQLKRMTNGGSLGNTYGVTLDRIRQSGGKSRLAMAALMWISHSERPMSADELCQALGVQTGSTVPNPDNIPSIESLLASCLGLVIVDKEESTVRLVHFTCQEYLNSRSEMFQNPYAVMAEICLTYLNFDCIRELSPTLDAAPQEYPFLKHASSCWGHYARNKTTECVKSLALQLLDRFDSHISAKLLLRPHIHKLGLGVGELPEGFTGLHCVAYLGIDEIAEALLDMRDWDIDKADLEGCTPLIWASKNGCEGIIRLLLETAGARLNLKDTMHGQTPLSWAAESGQEGAVKLLLERDEADPESRGNSGRTPLSYAAECGSEAIVKMLLEREEVDPESRDDDGTTPLSYAARWGGEEIVKLLLQREEVDPESQDDYGRTPLSHAVGGGSAGTVKLLLGRGDVDPGSQDDDGRTPLSYAAECGSEEIVKLLLERGEVDLKSRDGGGGTPLSYAAECGSETIAKLLLQREGANLESRDNSGRTLLSYVAGSGSEGGLKLLLEWEGVNLESRDNDGRTPLSHAASTYRGEGAVKLLLEQEEVNPESRDYSGRTPLFYAAVSGNEGTAKLLLQREEVNPESRDNSGRTPLSHTAGAYRGERVVQLLLERDEVNPESRDDSGRTPLSHVASASRGDGVAKLLLGRRGVNPESRDNGGRTPLFYAAVSGIEGVLKLLLEWEGVNLESRDNFGQTPLSHAVSTSWNEEIVRLLLRRKGVNPESRDNDGQTPLAWASRYGEAKMVKLLLKRKDVNPESRDNYSRTPLDLARGWGGAEIVQLFLEWPEVNPQL